MRDRIFLAGLLALIVGAAVLSGCIGADGKKGGKDDDEGKSSEVEVGPPAGEATVSDTTGAIEGRVADDAYNPIPGARVTMLEPPGGNSTVTDADGRFVFSNLVPGQYKLVAERTGYDSLGMGVTVVAGEVSNLVFRLPEVVVEGLPRQDPYEFNGFFGCGSGTPAGSLNVCFLDPNNANVHYVSNVTEGLVSIVVTMKWMPNGGVTAQKLWMGVEYEDEARCGELGQCEDTRFAEGTGTTPLTLRVDEDQIRTILQVDENETVDPVHPLRIRVFPGSDDADPATVFLQQNFKIYVTLFYNQPAPEGFTGIPDQ